MIELDMVVEAGGWDDPDTLAALCQRAATAAAAAAPSRPKGWVAVTLLLTDDAAIRTLNRAWRGQDKATNVLSFPAAPAPSLPGEPRAIGDIALAFETVMREASAEGKPLHDHVAHLVVHGVLHLLGEDHLDDAQASLMETAEVLALASLGIADPYAEQDICRETAA